MSEKSLPSTVVARPVVIEHLRQHGPTRLDALWHVVQLAGVEFAYREVFASAVLCDRSRFVRTAFGVYGLAGVHEPFVPPDAAVLERARAVVLDYVRAHGPTKNAALRQALADAELSYDASGVNRLLADRSRFCTVRGAYGEAGVHGPVGMKWRRPRQRSCRTFREICAEPVRQHLARVGQASVAELLQIAFDEGAEYRSSGTFMANVLRRDPEILETTDGVYSLVTVSTADAFSAPPSSLIGHSPNRIPDMAANAFELDWHRSIVTLELHRGGGYNGPKHRSSSIYEGGTLSRRTGVLVVCADVPSVGWVYFDDGDMQAVSPDSGFPARSVERVRQATDAEIDRVVEAAPSHCRRYVRSQFEARERIA